MPRRVFLNMPRSPNNLGPGTVKVDAEGYWYIELASGEPLIDDDSGEFIYDDVSGDILTDG
jgi:hypothetical protein